MTEKRETLAERAERLKAEAEALARQGKKGLSHMKYAQAMAARQLEWTD